jgi:hypothetical protein
MPHLRRYLTNQHNRHQVPPSPRHHRSLAILVLRTEHIPHRGSSHPGSLTTRQANLHTRDSLVLMPAIGQANTYNFTDVSSPGDPAFTQLRGINNSSTIAEFGFALHQIQNAMEPTLPLTQVLNGWNRLATALPEPHRNRAWNPPPSPVPDSLNSPVVRPF